MKVAITAVSGQLGSAIAKEAIKVFGKENITGTARNTEKASTLEINVVKADYNSKEDFVKAFQGIETALIISGMDAPDKRIIQHRNIINAAKEAGVRKIVYSSIIGKPGNSTFDGIVNSNRQSEEDIKNSGLDYAIGRNGLYLEPDLEFLENYIKDGKITNCAADGKCSYTTRNELAVAYAQLLKENSLNGKIYNIVGEAITQTQLVGYFNKYFGTSLVFESQTPEEYQIWQKELNGEIYGAIIAGIYHKIRNDEFEFESDFEKIVGRKHKTIAEIFNDFKNLK